jgi:thymidylate synthase (FAD)
MKTKLISLTSGSTDGKLLSAEELIVYTARVSNPENQMNFETSDRLIAYLIKHKHWSPFEMADMTIEITTSRAIAAQILRHRFSFQEFSQRYSKAQISEQVQLRLKAETNRQSSSNVLSHSQDEAQLYISVDKVIEKAFETYEELISHGVAKECARMILPLSTSTTMYMKGSIRSWIHYLEIRCDEHTQAEHRWIAEEIKEIFKTELPNIARALDW